MTILGRESQFLKREEGTELILEYDYGSIVHYKANAFAKDPFRDTITTPNGYVTLVHTVKNDLTTDNIIHLVIMLHGESLNH